MYNQDMFRTQIYLPEELHQLAKMVAQKDHESLAEFIRRCVENGIKEKAAQASRKHLSALSELGITGGPKDLSKKIDIYLYGS